MARVTVEDCLSKVEDQFALVHLASMRYRQLHRGADHLVKQKKGHENKNVVMALREIATGKVTFREDVRATVRAGRVKPVSQRLEKLAAGEIIPREDLGEAENATPLI